MKRLVMLTALGLTLVFASNGLAAGYGAAGCGWGGKVIKNNDILSQLGATVLNGFLSNQTFGISSGTSGCGKSGLVLAENEQKVFVENNYEALAKEMAAGEGENLTVLGLLLGCQENQNQTLGSFTQLNYASLFKTNDTKPAEMLIALKEGLADDPVYTSSCQKI